MSSRKEEKEARKRARVEAEEAAAAEQGRKRLLTAVGAAALTAVLVVVALIGVSQSGSDDTGNDTVAGVSEVEQELAGVPQADGVLGGEGTDVTIREFGDLQCPACAQFSETVIPDLIAGPVEAGDARLEFLNFTILGPDSEVAARAALAASEQDRYWQFVELFYRNQGQENSGYVTDEFLAGIAEGAGVPDIEAWNESRAAPKWDARLAGIQSEAAALGLTGTPSIVVEGPGGTEVLGTPGSAGEVEAAIAKVG